MTGNIKIAVDAMGGENSPKKVIDGILENYRQNKDIIYNIFGDEEKIKSLLPNNFDNKIFKITNTKNIVEDKKSGEYRLSHHIDLKSGTYRGRQVLDPKE